MTITAAGFDGSVTEADWSLISNNSGSRYAVGGATDFQVTARPAASLTANIAPGTAYGCGVRVTSDAQITTSHSTVGSGSRWDAIVLRRDWSGTGGTASVVVIPGTSTRAVPSGRFSGPGVKDDQVLALVQITAGQSLFTQVIDMRRFPSKVVSCYDLLAITDPVLGAEAVVLGTGTAQDTRWRYQIDATGNPAWERDETAHAQRTITALTQGEVLTTTTGWDAGFLDNQAVIDGNHVEVWLEFRLESARLVSGTYGQLTATTVACTLSAPLLPQKGISGIPFTYYGGDVNNPGGTGIYGGLAALDTAGNFTILQLTPNVYMNVRTGSTDISLRAHFSFTRKVPY